MALTRHATPRSGAAFLLLALVCALLPGAVAKASNPRWVSGPPYFNVSGKAVIWYTDTPLYYTDPGDLSQYVNHAAADALVAAAAGVWNVPVSMIVLQQGGTLAEQVSSANTYLGGGGLVFPADVQSTNYAAKQIAIIYDRDGSVTDLLLGGGASEPSSCLQNAVTESVDSITPGAKIEHAVLILNGRCTGPAPEAQLQMQYQLERAFGRVLGLGWSQLNDNVFTGTPQPTYNEALHWPIMHPIDVICGPYTYQCLPEPFTLRDDDIASLVFLYGVTSGNVPPGKQVSLTQAGTAAGIIRFPTYEGMAGMNVLVRRNQLPEQVLDNYDDVSMVTGNYAMQLLGNPLTPKPNTLAGSFGEVIYGFDDKGFFALEYIPLLPGKVAQDILLRTEPLNPLYVGQYAIGPYTLSTVTPSGSNLNWRFNYFTPGSTPYNEPMASDASNSCPQSSDGTESAPQPVPVTGWWNDLSCSPDPYNPWLLGLTSWVSLPVRANRSLTAEMTALNESGYATANKLRPVVGIWSATDPLGSRPSLASSAVAFNSVVLGMTSANAQVAQAQTLRLAFSAETGDGRPDYNYQARVLYADTIAPASAGAGTQVTISGTGFRPGNAVPIGGVNASVTSWTANTILATVPRLSGVLPGQTANVDVAVTDLSTRGTTAMSSALQYVYTAPTYLLQVVTAPTSPQIVSLAASPSFSVKVTDTDGVTALVNTPVVFSAIAGNVSWGACGGVTCTVMTDSNGLATIGVTALAAGTVTLQAAAVGQAVQASFQAVPLVRTATISPQYKYLAAGAVASWTTTASFTQQGLAASSVPIVWASTTGHLTISSAQTATGSNGSAQAGIQGGPIAAGAQATGSVCAWGNVCGTITALGVSLNQLAVIVTGNGAQSIPSGASLLPVTFQITDAAGDPVAGATVHIHQTTRPWTPPCPGKGRCPTAPVHSSSEIVILSDSNGNVSVSPLDMGGAEVTGIVVASGNQGYASLTVQRHP